MTYQYLSTARLNAIPRPDHVGTPATRPAPQFDNPDALREAMIADAQDVNKRFVCEKPKVFRSLPDAEIVQMVKSNPGITAAMIAAELDIDRSRLSPRLTALEDHGCIYAKPIKGKPGTPERAFHYIKDYSPAKNGRPRGKGIRIHGSPRKGPRETIVFMQANPGCTSMQIAQHFRCSRKAANGRIRCAERWVKIRKLGTGGNQPARYWVEV